jgi:hypothetical protein
MAVVIARAFFAEVDVTLRRYPVRKGRLFSNRRVPRSPQGHRPDILITPWGTIEWVAANGHGSPGTSTSKMVSARRSQSMRRRVWTRRLPLKSAGSWFLLRTLQRIARDAWRLRSCVRYIQMASIACALQPPDPMLTANGRGPL